MKAWIHFDNGFFGGADIAGIEWIREFASRGASFVVTYAGDQARLEAELKAVSPKIELIPLKLAGTRIRFLDRALRLLGLDLLWSYAQFRSHKPAFLGCLPILITGGIPGAASIWAAAFFSKRELGVSPLLWVHSETVPPGGLSAFYASRIFQSWVHRHVIGRYVFVSQAARLAFERVYGMATERSGVLANFIRAKPESTARDVGAEPLCFGYVGHLVHYKGVDVLLHALSRISGRKWKAKIIGSGPERASLERLRMSLGLNDRVEIADWNPDVKSLYKGIDVLVLPSTLREGLPTTVLEGMALGIPTIGSRIGGIPEMIIEGQTGAVVSPGDPGALAQALERWLGFSAEERKGISERCQQEYARRYSTSVVRAGWESFLSI